MTHNVEWQHFSLGVTKTTFKHGGWMFSKKVLARLREIVLCKFGIVEKTKMKPNCLVRIGVIPFTRTTLVNMTSSEFESSV